MVRRATGTGRGWRSCAGWASTAGRRGPRTRTPNQLGYVVITVEFGRNERGLDSFDPGAQIDGLDFALEHPDQRPFGIRLERPAHPEPAACMAGVVERSVLRVVLRHQPGTAPARRSRSPAGREARLPGRDGTFQQQAELSLDDLQGAYARDEALAQALGMLQPVPRRGGSVSRQRCCGGLAPTPTWLRWSSASWRPDPAVITVTADARPPGATSSAECTIRGVLAVPPKIGARMTPAVGHHQAERKLKSAQSARRRLPGAAITSVVLRRCR